MCKFKDETGNKFGKLTVLKRLPPNKYKQTMWLCSCECGNKTSVSRTNLFKYKSCGCQRFSVAKKRMTTHGQTYTSTYSSWLAMKNRCKFKPKHYESISFCERWNSFENFLEDMGERPSGKTLDRINSGDNYCPNNCCWSTPEEQANNRKSNVLLTYHGITQTLKKWSLLIGISSPTLQARKYRGWSDRDIIEKPLRSSAKKI